MISSTFVLLGYVAKAHGLKGDLKLKAHLDDPHFLKGKRCFWAPRLEDEGPLVKRCVFFKPNLYILTLDGVGDRTHAESFLGRAVYIQRSDLPALTLESDVFYHTDLESTPVWDAHHKLLGTLVGIENFGAGDILIIEDSSGYRGLVPFHHDHVASIQLQEAAILTPFGVSCFDLNRPKMIPSQHDAHQL